MRRLLILWLLSFHIASADFSVYKQDGPNLVPIKNDEVAMLTEDLRVEVHADWSRVEAEIVLENQGPATTLQVALPQVVTPRVSSYSPMGKKTGLWDVALRIDGVTEPCTEVTGKFDHTDREATYFWIAPKKFVKLPVALGEHNVFPNAKLKWLSWELKFEPGQKHRVRIAYSLENGSYGGEVGASRLRYLLTTAGLWHGGKIGRLTMRVTFDEAFSIAHLQNKRAGLDRGYLEKRDGRVFYSRFDVEKVSPAEFKVEDASLVLFTNCRCLSGESLRRYLYFGD